MSKTLDIRLRVDVDAADVSFVDANVITPAESPEPVEQDSGCAHHYPLGRADWAMAAWIKRGKLAHCRYCNVLLLPEWILVPAAAPTSSTSQKPDSPHCLTCGGVNGYHYEGCPGRQAARPIPAE